MPEQVAVELVVLRVLVAVGAATLGGAIGVLNKRTSHYLLCSLVSFAAGALLAVTLVHILPEAGHLVGWPRTAAAATAGLVIFYVVGRFVYFICPACAASASEEQRGYVTLGILLVSTLALHSTVDGIAIAAGVASAPVAGMMILVAVSYHKIPEGLALVSVARLAGLGRFAALSMTVLIEMTTALGALVGLLVLQRPDDKWTGSLLALIAGSFLYVVGFALIKEMLEHERRSIVVFAILGFASIALLGLALGALGYGDVH